MPAAREASPQSPGLDEELKATLNAMHCPFCGHVSLDHSSDHDGCTACSCHASLKDVVAINVSVFRL